MSFNFGFSDHTTNYIGLRSKNSSENRKGPVQDKTGVLSDFSVVCYQLYYNQYRCIGKIYMDKAAKPVVNVYPMRTIPETNFRP